MVLSVTSVYSPNAVTAKHYGKRQMAEITRLTCICPSPFSILSKIPISSFALAMMQSDWEPAEFFNLVCEPRQICCVTCCNTLALFSCVKNKNAIHQPRLVHIGKNCLLCLEYGTMPQLRRWEQFFQIRTSWLVNNICYL